MSSKKQIYLPGLNGVRFIAALLVVLDHIELFKGYLGFQPLWPESYSSYLGSFGVTIFFTLSGFLITYLLGQERAVSGGNINIRNFYIRRMLRIWPLYFLMVILSFFILPHLSILDTPIYGSGSDIQKDFWPRLLLFITLLPNVAMIYFPTVPFGNVLWSVGVEEQFYLFWPVLIKKIRLHITKIAIFCLAVYMLIRWAFSFDIFHISTPEIISLIVRTRFSCMLIGAIAAGCVGFGLLKTKWVQWTGLIVFLAMLGDLINFPLYNLVKNEAQAIVVALLLINISMNRNTIFKFENRILNYLGKISYGLYVYHVIAVVISIKLLAPLYSSLNYGVWYMLIFLLVMALTILISHISYFYFEKKLLNIKEKYSAVISGDQVEPELASVKETVNAKDNLHK